MESIDGSRLTIKEFETQEPVPCSQRRCGHDERGHKKRDDMDS